MEAKTYIGSLELNKEQKGFIISVINRYGTGQHPVCDECTFAHFTISYLIEILFSDKFIQAMSNLSETGKTVLDEIQLILKEVE